MLDPVEEKKDVTPGSEAAMQILKDIQEKLAAQKPTEEKPPVVEPIDQEKLREDLRKKTGLNDEALRHQEEVVANATAPLIEKLSWTELESKHKDLAEYRKDVEAELAKYDPRARTTDLMEKLLWMVKGRSIDRRPPAKPEPKVIRERVSGGGYSGSEPSLSGAGGSENSGEPTLSEDEQEVVDRLGAAAASMNISLDAKSYDRSKKSNKIGQFKQPISIDTRTAGPADKELSRLLGK